MNAKGIMKPLIMVLLFTLVIGGPASYLSAAAAEQKSPFRIVAIGDSVTAGFEPQMLKEKNPVPYGYADRLKEQGLFRGRTELINYGILGLKSEGLNHYVSAIQAGSKPTADEIQSDLPDPRIAQFISGMEQAKKNLETADVITITIGGNDLAPLVMESSKLTDSDLAAKVKAVLETYMVNLRATLTNLRAINPNALIVLADQYQPVPEIAGAANYKKLEKAASDFSTTVDAVIDQFSKGGQGKIKAAHIAKPFVGNEMTYTHILQTDIHPTQLGYDAITKVFAEAIWGDYRQVAGQQPLSVVVRGKELKTTTPPVVKNGQTFVAIGDIVQAIGASSKWDSSKAIASVTFGNQSVVIPIGSITIKVNGVTKQTAPAFLQVSGKNSKTYVPLALFAEGLGLDVQYSPKLKTAFINL